MAKKERKMKLDKNGYLSENRGSFATAMKVLTLIFGLGVAAAAVCVYAMFSGCGSNGSGDRGPVYDDAGVCVANCSSVECPPCGYFDGEGNCVTSNCQGDGIIYPPSDTCDHDGCYSQGQQDYVAPPCHIPTDPKIKEWCMPYWAQISKCLSTWEHDILCGSPEDWLDGKDCYCYGEKAYDPETNGAKSCDTVADCQPIACEEWPPEVCQGLPCQLVGKWDCPFKSVWDYTDLEFYDNGDKYCRFDDFNYKPGDSVIRSNDGEVIKLTKFCNSPGANELLSVEDIKACESDEDCTDFPSGPCKGIDAWGDDGLCAGDSVLRYKCQSSNNCNYVPDNNFCNGEFCQHGSFPCTSDEDCQEASALYRTCFGACAKTGETCEYIHGGDTCPLNIKSTCNLKLEGLQKIDAEGNVTAQCFKIEE